jgi:hypothetical protein
VPVIPAAYDPYGTAIRLSYDPEPGRNLLDNPLFAHEVTHYGQNLTTGLGAERILFAHELFAASVEALGAEAGPLRLPLFGASGEPARSAAEQTARLVRAFEEQVIGPLDPEPFARWRALTERPLRTAAYNLDLPNPFYFVARFGHPGFGVRWDGTDLEIPLDGRFVEELHAVVVQFISRWLHDQLEIDDAIEYFASFERVPYFLPVLMALRLLFERSGRALWNLPDAAVVCHLSAQLALNGAGLAQEVQTDAVIKEGSAAYKFLHPGRLFSAAFSAAVDSLQQEGALDHYFELMGRVATALRWPQFDELMETVQTRTLGPLTAAARKDPSTYEVRKLADAEAAICELLRCADDGDAVGFIRSPVEVVANGRVSGPLLVTPHGLSTLFAPDVPEALRHTTTEHVRHYLFAVITHKLAHERTLSCFEPAGGPFKGSAVACHSAACGSSHDYLLGPCRGRDWLQALSMYPNLAPRLDASTTVRIRP